LHAGTLGGVVPPQGELASIERLFDTDTVERVTKNELPSLRQSVGAAPLTALQSMRLIDTVDALLDEREAIAKLLLGELPSSLRDLRQTLNELARIVR
jgi:hypothetical protein